MSGPGKYIFMLVFITCILQLEAQHTQRVELSFNPDQFRIVASEDAFKVEADDACYYYLEDSGNPALPVRNVNILVPNGAELVDFNFSMEEEIIKEDISLARVATPVPFSLLEQYQPAETGIFEGDFPGEVVRHSATRIQRGYTWFSFTFSPFNYDGQKRELSLVSKLILDVEYRIITEQASVVRPDKTVLHALKESMVNPQEMDHLYPAGESALLKSSEDPLDYLIITTEELKPGFEALLHWKRRKGLRAELITLQEVYSGYDGPGVQLKIKRCLHDYYTRRNLKWVLLGGDHDVVPVQGCYTKLILGVNEYVDESVPTDLFYACFDQRFDWNSTVDEKIGQLYWDQHDLVPEISISRIPVRNMEQVRTFVRKTLSYELNPPGKDFAENMLLSGIKSWSSWAGKSDNHHRSEIMFERYIKKGWSGRKVNFFDTGTDFDGGMDYQVTASNLIDQLDKGYGIFHYAGHGNRDAILMESGKSFNSSDALKLRNPFSGIMLSTSCDVNAFDAQAPCLAESFLENPDGGAVAFFGSSRYGFGNPDQDVSLGPSFQYSARFLKHLAELGRVINGNCFASIAALTKSDFAFNGSSAGSYLFLIYALNAMGDPELPIHTRDPSSFDNVRLYSMDDALTVNTGGNSNCRICITSQDLSEGYHQVVEGVSHFTFEHIPEQFQVTITAPNYIPYQYSSASLTAMESSLSSRIRIYPNPASEFLIIDTNILQATLQLFDMQGRLMMEQELEYGSGRLDLSGYPEGAYLLKVLSDEGIAWFRFIKQSS
ncbi:MAG: T9SS type A sorting domain-containing protein [Bacteroidetes bacterium]|nr:T9SS type A sorting domain-containing protein [Bacteroidota bacterium]